MTRKLKIQSIILCLCMLVSAFSSLSALAADPFELVSWDADLDFITLDFNQEVDAENAVISLTADGETVTDFAFAKNDISDDAQANSCSRYTYLLAPEDGLEEGVVYELVIETVENSDGTEAIEDITKTFIVEVIGDDTNFVNIDPYKKANDFDWYKDPVTGHLSIDDYALPGPNKMEGWSHAGALVGDDNDGEHELPNPSAIRGTGTWTEKDYTMKVTFKTDERLGRAGIYFGIGRSLESIFATSNTTTDMTALYLYENKAYPATAHDVALYLSNGSSLTGNAVENLVRGSVPDLDYTEGVELKLSSKDGVVRTFIDGKKAIDAKITVAPGYPFFSIRGIAGDKIAGGTTTYTATDFELYDFLVTRCVEASSAELDKEIAEIDDSVVVTFDEAIAEGMDSKISLKDSEGNDVEGANAVLSPDGTQATISFTGLDYREEYTVSFDTMKLEAGGFAYFDKLSFMTVEPPKEIYSFEIEGGGEIEGTPVIEAVLANNLQDEPWIFTATIAIYNSKGQMVKVAGGTYTLAIGEADSVIIDDFTCDPEETYTAKCFVWDSFTGMNKQFEAVIGE